MSGITSATELDKAHADALLALLRSIKDAARNTEAELQNAPAAALDLARAYGILRDSGA